MSQNEEAIEKLFFSFVSNFVKNSILSLPRYKQKTGAAPQAEKLLRASFSFKSNPVPHDPISAIHPPHMYAGDGASAMGFDLCRSKMMNGIVALHSPPMRKDAAEKNGTLLRSAGCIGSRITSELFTLKFKHVGAKCYPALLLRSNRSLLMLLRRRFFAFSSL
ncbi:hypothetical protein ACLOJK_024102 [Asimina triloba]